MSSGRLVPAALLPLAVCLAALLPAGSALAQTARTWAGTSGDMATAANWSPEVVPSATAGDTMRFDGSGVSALTFPGTTFSANAGLGGLLVTADQATALSITNAGPSSGGSAVFRLRPDAPVTIEAGAGAFSFGASGTSFFLNLANSAIGHRFTNDSASIATLGPQATLNATDGTGGYAIFAGTGNWLVSGEITAAVSRGLVKEGSGTLTLSNANNTFTGGLTIAAGQVAVGNTNALGPVNSQITVASGAALDINGGITVNSRDYNITIAGTGTDGAGAIFNNGTNRNFGFKTLTLAADATIGGTGRFDVRPATQGEGRLNLGGFTLTKSGTNVVAIVDSQATQDGSINVTGGVLGLTRTTVSGAGAINVSGGAQLYLENNNSNPLPTITKAINLADGATLRNTGAAAGFTVGSVVSLAGTTTWDMSGNPLAMTGIISGSGSLTKTGAGTLTLSAASTYSGTTTITAGTIRLAGGADRLGTTALLSIADAAGATLDLAGNDQRVNGLTGGGATGGQVVNSGGSTAVLTLAAGTDRSYSGTIEGDTRVVVAGTSNLAIQPRQRLLNTANAYTGGTVVSGNALLVRADGSFGAVPDALDPVNITLENAGLFFNDNAAVSLDANRGIRLGPGGGGMLAGFSQNVTINGPISGDAANSLTILANNGTVIWTADNTFAGPLVVRGTEASGSGRLQVGAGGTTGTLGTGPVEILTGGQITFNRTGEILVPNSISGGGTIIKEGTGTLVLSGNNSFGSGTFTYGGGASQDRGAIRLASETALGNFTTINLTGDNAGKRQIQLSGGNTYAYSITTSGLTNPQADGAALVNVDGGNTWNGDISIADAGGAYGIRSDAGTLTINGAVQRTLSSNDTRNWQLGGAGDVVVNGAVQVVSAQGVMGLVKFGTGTLTLANAANTYSGATTVSAGTLLVNGALLNTSGVTVNAGAVLGGSGSIAATLAGAGLVSPGNSPGITTANAVDPTGGLGFGFEFTATGSPDYGNAAASLNDVLRLTSGTPFTASLSGANAIDVYFDLATLGGGDTFRGGFYTDLAGDFLPSIENAAYAYWVRGDGFGTDRTFNGQGFYSLANFGAGLSVTVSTVSESADFGAGPIAGQVSQFVVVPEPATLVLLAGGAAAAGWLVRRRSHAGGR